jgi:hypothetical protein
VGEIRAEKREIEFVLGDPVDQGPAPARQRSVVCVAQMHIGTNGIVHEGRCCAGASMKPGPNQGDRRNAGDLLWVSA